MIHDQSAFRAVDEHGVIHFPPAAERARLRAQSVERSSSSEAVGPTTLSPDPGNCGSAGAPVPAAAPVMSDNTHLAAGTFLDPLGALSIPFDRTAQLPLAALDRPCLRPQGNARGEGETHADTLSAEAGPTRCSLEAAGLDAVSPAGTEPGRVGAPALPGTGPDGSLALVLQKRLEHVRLGYDAAHDARLPPTSLVDQAAKYLGDAHDLIRRNADAAKIRLKLVNAAALGLAALDRELARTTPPEPDHAF